MQFDYSAIIQAYGSGFWELCLDDHFSFEYSLCNSYSVQPVVPVSVSPSLCSNRGLHPPTGARSAWAESGMGIISVDTLRLKGGVGKRESGQEEMVTMWGDWTLGGGRPPQHQTGLKISAAPILCFRPAGVGCWPACPSRAVGTHVGQESAQELQLRCLQLIQAQHPAVMGTILCEQTEWKNGKCFRKNFHGLFSQQWSGAHIVCACVAQQKIFVVSASLLHLLSFASVTWITALIIQCRKKQCWSSAC